MTPNSVIQIRAEDNMKSVWTCKSKINYACSNSRQLAISIEQGQLVYFEFEDLMNVLDEKISRFMETEVTCLDICEVPDGRTRFKFLAVGF